MPQAFKEGVSLTLFSNHAAAAVGDLRACGGVVANDSGQAHFAALTGIDVDRVFDLICRLYSARATARILPHTEGVA